MPHFIFILVICFSAFFSSCALSKTQSAKSPEKQPKSEKLYDIQLGETYQKNDLVIIVKDAQITGGALAIRYRFINNNVTKKVDLGEKFKFSLSDEYGNLYRLNPAPADYPHVVRVNPPRFPSLYPGEELEEIVFFEAPIPHSSFLFFNIDPVPIGPALTVKIPMQQVGREIPYAKIEEIVPEEAPVEPKIISDFLKIRSPQENQIVYKGEAIKIDVELGGGLGVPESIVVTSPDYTLRDLSYGLHYSVIVPPEYPKDSMTVVVIAKWPGEGSGKLLSDSMTFTVNDLKEKCVQDCLSGSASETDAVKSID